MTNPPENTTYLIYTNICENDKRGMYGKATTGNDVLGASISKYDWKVWSASGFGQRLQRAFSDARQQVEVSDFGQQVVVRAQQHNPATGRSEAKTFCIVFDDPRGNGTIWGSSTKFRTIGSLDQAVSYIRGIINNYAAGSY